VLRTRAPLYSPLRAFSLDLHVLGTPPAFVLSQDQTLQLRVFDPASASFEAVWLVFQMIRQLKECGTAFLRRLAIQFSKTEQLPLERDRFLVSSLTPLGVSKTSGLRSGGGGF
jgi:hypothetical protein